jgi:hypothetical protein
VSKMDGWIGKALYRKATYGHSPCDKSRIVRTTNSFDSLTTITPEKPQSRLNSNPLNELCLLLLHHQQHRRNIPLDDLLSLLHASLM